MKMKKSLKRIIGITFVACLLLGVLGTTVEVSAMSGSTRALVERRYINRNGVRLHKEGKEDSTVLGLMYINTAIDYYADQVGEDPNYVYMHREEDPSYGYVYKYYTSETRV